MTGTDKERPGLNESLAAVRAGSTLVVTKLDRCACRYPMLMNLIEELTTVSQEFPLPTRMAKRI